MDKKIITLSVLLLTCAISQAHAEDVIVIGHPDLPKLDRVTIEKLFTGRIIEINHQPAIVVNAAPGSATRQQFLMTFLAQDEDKYRAYWVVRRFIGKGTPPKDLASSREIIEFVQSQPGGIGYISAVDRTPELNVLIDR
jgi:ABC-type phosphate transport system substrate-binding protein